MRVCKKERGMSTQRLQDCKTARLQDCKTARLQIMQGVFRYVKCFSHFFRVRDITILIERILLCHTLSIRYNYENSKARRIRVNASGRFFNNPAEKLRLFDQS